MENAILGLDPGSQTEMERRKNNDAFFNSQGFQIRGELLFNSCFESQAGYLN